MKKANALSEANHTAAAEAGRRRELEAALAQARGEIAQWEEIDKRKTLQLQEAREENERLNEILRQVAENEPGGE